MINQAYLIKEPGMTKNKWLTVKQDLLFSMEDGYSVIEEVFSVCHIVGSICNQDCFVSGWDTIMNLLFESVKQIIHSGGTVETFLKNIIGQNIFQENQELKDIDEFRMETVGDFQWLVEESHCFHQEGDIHSVVYTHTHTKKNSWI